MCPVALRVECRVPALIKWALELVGRALEQLSFCWTLISTVVEMMYVII
jgi:hypothetical protein